LLTLLAGFAMSPAGATPATDRPATLPASFSGSLPCAGSAGAGAQLDLWPDGVFHLQRTCLGQPGRDDDRGRWQLTPDGDGIRLHGGREMPLAFAWRGHNALVPLDAQGRPGGDDGSGLRRLPDFAPAGLQLALHGMFRYLADAAGFEECLTGRSYPVAMEGDFVALERAYMASDAGGTGTPIMASFDGEIAARPAMEGGGATPTVIVRRFVNLWPGGRCERAMSRASLAETYWKLVRLRGEAVVTSPRQREAHLILHSGEDRYKGSFGCFRYDGQYRVNGGEIAFDGPRWTAEGTCMSREPNPTSPPRSDFTDALGAVDRWTINAQVLELFDATGTSVALFEAVYLR
jgi:copper homeostasis protein (lipoprotein)